MSGRSVGEKRGSSYQNLHSRPLSHEEYYCEYIFLHIFKNDENNNVDGNCDDGVTMVADDSTK